MQSRDIQQDLVKAIITADVSQLRLILCQNPTIHLKWPLIRAMENNRLDMVQYLITAGADIDLDAEVLHHAVEIGRVTMVDFLLQTRPELKTDLDANVASYLRLAAARNFFDIINSILTTALYSPSDLDEALICAAANNHRRIVELLLNHGANIHCENEAALKCAYDNNNYEMMDYLIGKDADLHANHDLIFRQAALQGRLYITEKLLQQGCNPNAKDYAAITSAYESRNLAMLQLLYKYGGDITKLKWNILKHSRARDMRNWLRTKQWLHLEVSELRRLAAQSYVSHYATLPDASTVPEIITDILFAAQC